MLCIFGDDAFFLFHLFFSVKFSICEVYYWCVIYGHAGLIDGHVLGGVDIYLEVWVGEVYWIYVVCCNHLAFGSRVGIFFGLDVSSES